MTTATPPTAPTTMPATPRRPQNWRWAIGAFLTVVIVIVATLAGRYTIAHARQAAQVVPAQALPPLPITAVIAPGAGVALFGVDDHHGRLAALTYAHAASCPPTGDCPAEPSLASFMLLDDATGAALATTPLTGALSASAQATVLLVDGAHGVAYALSAHHVDRFSTVTGAALGGYDLPADATWGNVTGAALSANGGRLFLLGGDTLLAISATSGQLLAHATFSGGGALSGPDFDAADGRLFVEQSGAGSAPDTLVSLAASDLHTLGTYTLPTATLLGPLDPATGDLYTFGADGSVGRLAIASLAVSASAATGGAALQLSPEAQPELTGARALGWDANDNRLIAQGATTTTAFVQATPGPAGTPTPLASLPLAAPWPATQPLPVDAQRGVVALAADGEIGRASCRERV